MPGSKGQKAVHTCMIRLLNLRPAKHEEVAIYIVNLRIPNVCRIVRVCFATEQSVAFVGANTFCPQHHIIYIKSVKTKCSNCEKKVNKKQIDYVFLLIKHNQSVFLQ